MAGNNNPYIELLKYPIAVFAVLIALIIARFALNITFGPVTKVSTGGVEFTQASTAKLGDLEGKVNGLAMELEAMKNASSASTVKSTRHADRSLEARIFEATQTVSDQTAQLATLGARIFPSKARQTGFIWIGDYIDKWDPAKLGSTGTDEPVTSAPDELQTGIEYEVLDNMVIREHSPKGNQGYLVSPISSGILPRGSLVRLLQKPVRSDTVSAVQYWAKVEVVK